jgi:hypothetical protein
MKSAADRQRDTRRRMRAAGFVLRQLWVHPADWAAVKAYVKRRREGRTSDETYDVLSLAEEKEIERKRAARNKQQSRNSATEKRSESSR